MPIKYRVPSSPFLSRPSPYSALDLLPAPLAAARVPASFLAKKGAAYAAKLRSSLLDLTRRSKAVRRFGKRPEDYVQPFDLEDYDRYITPLYNSEMERALRPTTRAKDALDLWLLRNMNVGQAVKESTGAADLYDWYRAAEELGPWEP